MDFEAHDRAVIDSLQSANDELEAEITRLRDRLAEAEAGKADAWDEAMNVALGVLPVPPDRLFDDYDAAEANTIEKCAVAIRALVNPYRSKP